MIEDYVPSEDEQQTVTMVKSWLKNAKKAKAERKAVIDKCYKAYKGEHYTEKEKLKKNKSMRNYIFASVEDALALLTDQKPVIDCWPRSGIQDVQIAEKSKQVLDWVWEETKMSEKLPMILRDSLITGIGGLKVYFDYTKNYPYGEIAVDIVNVDHIHVDADATKIDLSDCKYVIQDPPTPLWMIRRDYPEKGMYVKPEKDISGDMDDGVRFSSDTNKEIDGRGALIDTMHHRARLIECWVKDDAMEDYEEEDKETGEMVTQQRPMYPTGRRIVIAGDVLLSDGPNPFQDGEFPYVFFPDYEQTSSFWPLGDVEFIIEVNNDINKIVSRLNDYIRMTAHTHIVYDDACGLDEKHLTNLEGAIIPISKGGTVTITPPPNFPPAVFEWLTTCKSDLEIIHGIRQVLQGIKPDAGQSGVAFERLQEFAMSRIRKKARNIDNGVIRLGERFISRIKQYYTDDRQVRITGDFPIQQMDLMTGQPQIDPSTGQPMTQGYRGYDFVSINGPQEFYDRDEQGNVVREVELDVVLEMGSSASVTRSRDRQDAAWLFEKGIIDAEEVAKRYGIKNYREIEARMMQKAQQQMLMQAQAQEQARMEALVGGGDSGMPVQG